MLTRPCGFVLHITRQNNTKQKTPLPSSSPSTVNVFSPLTFSSSPFMSSPKRSSSNRLTRTLHPSVLQGHTLLSRGPRHPRPAPLVLQVVVSQQPCHVIDWGEGIGVLGFTPTPLSHIFLAAFWIYILTSYIFFFSPPALLSPIPPLFSHCL